MFRLKRAETIINITPNEPSRNSPGIPLEREKSTTQTHPASREGGQDYASFNNVPQTKLLQT